MHLVETISRLMSESGNWGAVAFGLLGMIVTAYFAYRAKKPMMKQATENSRFTTTMRGMETLNEGQAARIVFLEQQLRLKDEYEEILIRRHRECEERCAELIRRGL